MTAMKTVAGYLPGLQAEELQWQTLSFHAKGASLDVAVPVLSPAQMVALAERVRQASRTYLKTWDLSRIITLVDRVIARLLDPNDPYRQEAERLLPLVTGYDTEMVRLGLTGYLKTFRQPQLQRFVAEDFANPKLLDEFQPRPKGGFAKAVGPDLLVHVWAGNVPGLPLWSLISGLLVKAGNVGKLPSAEPLMAGWFARLLVEVDPQLADCLAVVWWQGGDEEREQALFQQADLVLAYGGNEALAQIRRQVPITTRFLAHGHKLSFGMISSAALDARKAVATARQAAYDVVRYDQQGCYSPQVFYVERGGKVSPREFSQYLAHELAGFEHKFPRRALPLEDAASVAGWRQTQELKQFSQAGADVMGDMGSAWSVAYVDQPQTLAPTALNRTIQVVAVDRLAQVIPQIAKHRAFLQTVGLAATPVELFELAELLGLAGVTRICAIGAMTAPEAGWHHDGRFNLLDLIQMVEIEQSAELSAETFAPYVD
jgi:hypothetical protein